MIRPLPIVALLLISILAGACKSVRKTKMRAKIEGEEDGKMHFLDVSKDKRSDYDMKAKFKKGGGLRTDTARLGGREDLATAFVNREGGYDRKSFRGSESGSRFAGENFYGGDLRADLPERPRTPLYRESDKRPRGTTGDGRGWAGAEENFGLPRDRDGSEGQGSYLLDKSSEEALDIQAIRNLLNK